MRILGTVASSSREVPGAPSIGTATDVGTGRAFNNGAAIVTFTAPAFDGGFPILDYTVTSSPGGFTATGASSPLTVTGLQSSTSYTFTVTARTTIGTGPASAASNSITATTVPAAPTIGTATCATGQAYTGSANISVPFTAGATGGAAISSYTATSSGGGTQAGGSSPISFSRSVGTSYTFTVTATNANGTSAASSASNSVLSASVPQAPTIGTATVNSSTAVNVVYTGGQSGGSNVITYTATSSPGGLTATGTSGTNVVSGLTTGTAYTFTVTATNAYGTSTASSASNSVSPNYTGVSAWTISTAYPYLDQYPAASTQGTSNAAWFGTGAVGGGSGTTGQGAYWNGTSWTNLNATYVCFLPGQARWDKDNAQIQGGYVFGSDFYQTNGTSFNSNSASSLNTTPQGRLGWAISRVSNGMVYAMGENSITTTTYYKTSVNGGFTVGTALPVSAQGSAVAFEDGTFSYGTFYLYQTYSPVRTTAVASTWTTQPNSPFGTSSMYYVVAGGGSTGTTGVNIVGVRDNNGIYRYTAASSTFTATTSAPNIAGNSFSLGTTNSNTRIEWVNSQYLSSGTRAHYYATLV